MSLYWFCKEEIAVSKAVLLFDLHEMLGVSDIASFTTGSPATIRGMIIVLSDIIKAELVKKIKESKDYACLIDEVNDISNVNPADIYLLKVNKRNTRTRCEICSKLTIKIPERRMASF